MKDLETSRAARRARFSDPSTGWFLGLGGSKHDYSACLVRDGRVVVAVEEERVTRKKRGYGVAIEAAASIPYVLDACGIGLEDVEAVCVNDILATGMYEALDRPRLVLGHHLCHAASAWYPSGFAECAVLVADHSGGRFPENGRLVAETFSGYHARDGALVRVYRVTGEDEVAPLTAAPGPDLRGNAGIDLLKRPRNSIGRLYARVARKCGCVTRMGDGELHTESGKLMGLAAYGDRRFHARMRGFVELGPEGGVEIAIGRPGEGLEGFCAEVLAAAEGRGEGELFAARAALARAAQEVLEEVVVHAARHLQRTTGSRRLALAGGVCLNGLANHRILEETGFREIYVQPASHDAGVGLGAAWLGWSAATGRPPVADAMPHAYLGRTYSAEECERALAEAGVPSIPCPDWPRPVARALAGGRIVALFEGASEIGPRALGHRSILADCRDAGMKEHLNRRIKLREAYRPYAPAVRAEEGERYFEMRGPSPHMLLIGHVREEWRDRLPAITHVDGTARVQTVDREHAPRFHELLGELARETGVGVVLNTSMNVMGEPIVESPADAVRFLTTTRADLLVLDGRLCARTAEELRPFGED